MRFIFFSFLFLFILLCEPMFQEIKKRNIWLRLYYLFIKEHSVPIAISSRNWKYDPSLKKNVNMILVLKNVRRKRLKEAANLKRMPLASYSLKKT
jgi:hypothetical protein